MSLQVGRLLALVMPLVVVAATDCGIGDIGALLNKPGGITVTNSGTEPAVVAILADDVKSYPTLTAGASASVETNVGGRYQVRVVMTPENAQRYRQTLDTLRQLVEKQIGGSASSEEKTRLFVDLAGIKAAIQALEQTNAAGCSGNITLSREGSASVTAVVRWVPQGDTGFWDATCGST